MSAGAVVLVALLAGCAPAVARGEGVSAQLEAEVRAARQRLALLEQQAADCPAPGGPGDIYPQLVQIFAGTEVDVVRDGARVVVTVPGDLLFSEGSTDVRREAAMVVDLLGTALSLHPDRHAWVVGHTDGRPLGGPALARFGDHRGLSLAMADALADAIAAQHGLPGARFTVAGRGGDAPLEPGDTPGAQARNRRVVVVIGPPDPVR